VVPAGPKIWVDAVHIETLLREFEPIRVAIARGCGSDPVALSPIPGLANKDPGEIEREALANFCSDIERSLRDVKGFPDADRYAWASHARFFESSFEAWGQFLILQFMILFWECRRERCEKTIILRCVNTGGYHIETYETAQAYFIVASNQFVNILNRYALLNHRLITLGEEVDPIDPMTQTNEVGGQCIERALRARWSECGIWLDEFAQSVVKAIDFRDSLVLYNEHVAMEARILLSSGKYVGLNDASAKEAAFAMPAEMAWTRYSDLIVWFTIAHELAHILRGDVGKPGRSVYEEFSADEVALEIVGYALLGLAQRSGYKPAPNRQLIICPAVFFAVSRLFAFLDAVASDESFDVASREVVMLMRRSGRVARLLHKYRLSPDGPLFWNVLAELRVLEVAARRWMWSFCNGGKADPDGVDQEIGREIELARREERMSDMLGAP
jgi:hypothetical protein